MSIFAKSAPKAARFAIASLIVTIFAPAYAQMALPGAVAPTPEGAITNGPKPAPAAAKKKKVVARGEMGAANAPAVMPKAPSEQSIVGKKLQLDGSGSMIEIARADGELQATKLSLSGDHLSRSGEQCRVDVAGMPLKLTQRDSDSGLRRYQIAFPACAFTLDVLDGAILVTNDGKACEIKEADCRADPEGLWGTGDADFDPKKGAEMLGARARVEKTVRGNFRALYQRNQKEKDVRDYVVKEQAGFSSWREEVCRSYAREDEFGYCALRLTEARAIALGAQLANGVKLPAGLAEAVSPEPAKLKEGKK